MSLTLKSPSDLLNRLKDFLGALPPRVFLAVVCVIQIGLHLRYISLPPVGFHQWRQTQTLAVARNFYEEDMNIFRPRVDNRGNGSGVAGMEFPLVNYLTALGYRVFGFSHTVGRAVVVLFSLLALVACYGCAARLFQVRWLAGLATLFLLFSPLFTYYSGVAMPDVPALALLLAALYFFLAYRDSGGKVPVILMAVCLMLAALIKISAWVALPFLVWEAARIPGPAHKRRAVGLALLLSVLPVLVWYAYAHHLRMAYHNEDYVLAPQFPYPGSLVPALLCKILVQWLPEMYLSYAQFALMAVGVYAISRAGRGTARRFVILSLAGCVVYVVAFLPLFEDHDYYALPALPFLVVLGTAGVGYLVEKKSPAPAWQYLTLAALAAMPVLGIIRGLGRLEAAQKPWDLLSLEEHLRRAIPDDKALVIAAGDLSPCIYLYFMHRKGWSVGFTLPEQRLLELHQKGARYLVSTCRELETLPEIQKHLRPISEHGSFRIFAVVPEEERSPEKHVRLPFVLETDAATDSLDEIWQQGFI